MIILYLVPHRAIRDFNTVQEATALQAAGHEVLILAPGGQLRGVRSEMLGADIPLDILSGGPIAPLKVLRFMRNAPKHAERFYLNVRVDAVMCRDLDTLAAGATIARERKAKLVFWPHDVYEHMIQPDVPRPLMIWLERHERKLLPKVDAFVASNQGVADWIVSLAPRDGIGLDAPTTLVMPCRDPDPEWVPPDDPRTLTYFGTLHENRFIRQMVCGMRHVEDAHLLVAGPRTDRRLYRWLERKHENVTFLGHISAGEVRYLTRKCGAVVSVLDPNDKCLSVGLANKVFDAISVGRPAIGTTMTATGDLIAEVGMGPRIGYSEASFVGAVQYLLDSGDMETLGKRAYAACRDGPYNWATQKRKLVDVFARL